MSCTSCSMIEGFENNDSFQNQMQPVQTIEESHSDPSFFVTGYNRNRDESMGAMNDYRPIMKSQCSYAAQPCVYTAQGTLMCPGKDNGYCGPEMDTNQQGPAPYVEGFAGY